MSIIGLTGTPRLPRIGSLRKGAVKPNEKQPGADLGEELRFVGQDDEITADWVDTFGDVKVDEIIIRLPFPTVDENWSAWKEAYVAGGMVHRCDGRTVVQMLAPDGTYDFTPRPCPGDCKPVGRLEVFVPAFQRLGTITVHTTSLHDIMNLDGCLRSLAVLVGDLTRVPFVLKRVRREISTPGSNGKRARRPAWLLHLEPSPEWVRAITSGAGLQELTATSPLALPGNVDLVDADTGEIIEGQRNGFTERVAGCANLDDLRQLWPAIQAIDEAAYKANVIALWRNRAVVIMRGMIAGADAAGRAELLKKLEALPAGTVGRDEAIRECEDAGFAQTPATMPVVAQTATADMIELGLEPAAVQ